MKLTERVAVLEANVAATRSDVAEIKADVRALLEARWYGKGKIAGIAAMVSAVVAFVASLLK